VIKVKELSRRNFTDLQKTTSISRSVFSCLVRIQRSTSPKRPNAIFFTHFPDNGNRVKVKQSRYRPGVAQRVPGSWGSQITWQRHRMVVSLSDLRTDRLYPRKCSWCSFLLEAESTPGPESDPIPMTPSGIEPANFRFVAQYLNHCATAVPNGKRVPFWNISFLNKNEII
jgi:hypothetical protein